MSVDKLNEKSYNRFSPQDRYRRRRNDQVISYAVLGLSLGALFLSVYAIRGGSVESYISKQQPAIAYANNAEPDEADSDESITGSDVSEVLGEGVYDITVKIDADGKRQYVLTPIDDAEVSSDEVTDTESSTTTSDSEVDAESDESQLSEESQAKLDEHISNRLRIQPDRDGSDIYYYIVEPGDSLSKISDFFDVPVGQLMEDNFIKDSNVIYVGDVIYMPTDFVK